MSSEQQIQQCSDLRGAAQDYKRKHFYHRNHQSLSSDTASGDATQKHKWANMATTDARGNVLNKPKPKRTSM